MKKALIYFCAVAVLADCTPATKKQDKTTPTKEASATVYTCPMHPDVAVAKPGACPKCGMDLVEKTQ